MRPLFRSLFVFAMFGMIAAHVTSRAFDIVAATTAPQLVALIDRVLGTLLIAPLGQDFGALVLVALGATCALWTYMASRTAECHRPAERFSTW